MRVTKQILLTLIIAWGSCASANDGIDWPEGLKRKAARMVRLQYARGNWDQDMGRGGDYNLLLWYQVVSQLNIAKDSESLRARELKALSDANLPAFLLVTGWQEVELTEEEAIAIRAYCLERGGLLVCSNGGRKFDAALRATLGRCFPDAELVDIPNDAPFFQQPFQMPHGAPPLWHHSGLRAQGIKVDGRWVVFYHQGDIVDAWQDSHSGVSEATAIAAYKMGFNLIHYAYTQRDRATVDNFLKSCETAEVNTAKEMAATPEIQGLRGFYEKYGAGEKAVREHHADLTPLMQVVLSKSTGEPSPEFISYLLSAQKTSKYKEQAGLLADILGIR